MSNRGYVVLTRDEEGNARWQVQLEQAGFKPYLLPCIHTVALEPSPSLINSLQQLNSFDWIIFTSASAVSVFSTLVQPYTIDVGRTARPRIAVVGNSTRQAAEKAGWPVSFRPTKSDATTLAHELSIDTSSHILWPRSAKAPRNLAEILAQRGANVVDVPIYTTEAVSEPDLQFNQLLQTGSVSTIVFASPSAVEGFQHRVGEQLWNAALSIPVVATGELTATDARNLGFCHILTAIEPTIEAVIETLRQNL